MIQAFLIILAIAVLLVVILYFMAKRINQQSQEIKELELKEQQINETNRLKEKINTGSNADQFDSTLDVLQELRKTEKRI